MSWIAPVLVDRGGAVSFREFMEVALYDPDHGYYTAGRRPWGRAGDYLTAPTASGWYAAVMARLAAGLAEQLGALTVVDAASGDGSWLAELLNRAPAGVIARGVAVERSHLHRQAQVDRFASARCPVEVADDLDAPDLTGGPVLVHASELYDALPVHRVVQRGQRLRELWVRVDDDALQWIERRAPARLQRYLDRHGISLVDGQIAEVNLAAESVHRRLLDRCGEHAVAVVLDYGYPAARLYSARGRMGGSLACYHRHRLSRDPLERPGEQDITAHVNWDDLRDAAAAAGWSEVGLWALAETLVRAGLEAEVEARGLGMTAELDADTLAERQEIKRLLDPEGMGSDLKVLVQAVGDGVAAAGTVLGVQSADGPMADSASPSG